MKIVIAPDSFKESLAAIEVARAIEKGFREVFPEAEYVCMPMADGGEGTVQALVAATKGRIVEREVTGPLGEPVQACFGLLGDGKTAVIEMAAASGLHLVPNNKRNPLITTTKGTGELIRAALDEGANHLIIGIGGSATNDGGAGMVQALGGRLLDKHGKDLDPGGGNLAKLASIDLSSLDPRLSRVKIEAACDVVNPLIGRQGAAAVFGPQKGATPEMVLQLEQNLRHYADMIERTVGKRVHDVPGAGAAGGLGAGLLAFLNAELKRGIDIVLNAVQFERRIRGASLIITGEGRIDGQTIYGKVPIGVAKAAKPYHIPVLAIAGSLGDDCSAVLCQGIDAIYSIVPGIISLTKAIEQAEYYITQTAKNIAVACKIGMNMK
ncbi:glycerate kinase family protein [Anoxybacillus sp. B7M1]|uniref:glycerate kinase n=1 Tax=unclassified Anoxybacillus TaxID=2639704 RepID=UPI0005CCA997|nr:MULTISPECIES: glycerate kinase [unclassified Anoxybacillus]ANB56689.1 glycerate kinase family protein [Anoxybacillus sp. B2M1]ANB66059.1 glycerate kinase family protein [Anoxybacillus sp. B7M1]